MRKINHDSFIRPAMLLMAGTLLAMSLTGCIRREVPDTSGGGGSTPGGTPCANLLALPSTYKGGDALGEELTLSVNASTLAYTINIDAGDQRAANTQITGNLVQLADCHYASDEAGAVFTFGANGVVQGGVKTVAGTSFAPLIAFNTTYNNSSAPTVFNDVATFFNAVGVQTTSGTTTSYGGSGRIRNAGTMQFCAGTYSANTCSTEKGYFTYNSTRNAFDYFALNPSASFPSPPTGGTAAGSMVMGVVDGVYVQLFLSRVSATDYGMRLLIPQVSLVSGAADGAYLVVDSSGSNSNATVSGSSFTRGTDATTLTFDSPIAGVATVAPTSPSILAGNLISAKGIYGFVPTSSGSAAFEMGLKE